MITGRRAVVVVAACTFLGLLVYFQSRDLQWANDSVDVTYEDSVIVKKIADEAQKLRESQRVGYVTKRIPDAVIVGAGKCGTDALISYLNISDSFVINTIHAAENMHELNYFNYNFGNGLSWYLDNMPAARPDQISIEKCAPYLWNGDVPIRIYNTKPDMKIIFVLCDPVKRLISLYTHINSYPNPDGTRPLPPLNEILTLDESTGKVKENVHPRPAQPFLETGLYSQFIKKWLQVFPREQMIFLSGEQMICDPLSEVEKVTEWLGKKDAITPDQIYYDTERGYYCFSPTSRHHYCMDKKLKGRKHPDVSPAMIKALQNHYQASNDELYSLINREFGWPSYFGNGSKPSCS